MPLPAVFLLHRRMRKSPASYAKPAFAFISQMPSLIIALKTPQNIQLIGHEVAIAWSDGAETYFPMNKLRAASPSAEQRGEKDIFGQRQGGTDQKDFPGVIVLGWERVGNYAIRFDFSDGHNSGLYSYELLLDLARALSA